MILYIRMYCLCVAVLEVDLHQLFRLGLGFFPGLRLNVEGLQVLLHPELLPPLLQSLASLIDTDRRERHGRAGRMAEGGGRGGAGEKRVGGGGQGCWKVRNIGQDKVVSPLQLVQ